MKRNLYRSAAWPVAMTVASALGAAGPLLAQQAPAPTPTTPVCQEVEVNGQRSPSYSCLSQQLQPAAVAPAGTASAVMGAEAITQRPSNALGLYNRAATEHRMGNNFGKSAYPQRPPAPAPGPSPFRN